VSKPYVQWVLYLRIRNVRNLSCTIFFRKDSNVANKTFNALLEPQEELAGKLSSVLIWSNLTHERSPPSPKA